MMLFRRFDCCCALGFRSFEALVTTATFVDGLLADTFDEVVLLVFSSLR